MPGFYGDPACRRSLAGTPNERAALQYAMPSPDGKTVFVTVGTIAGPPGRPSEGRFLAVFDVSDPYRPVQLASVPVGGGDASRSIVLTGDGKYLVVPNAVDSTVTIVDVASRTPVRNIPSVLNARLRRRSTTRAGRLSWWDRRPQPPSENLARAAAQFDKDFPMTGIAARVLLAFGLTAGLSAACDP